jgi:hypothetical protein
MPFVAEHVFYTCHHTMQPAHGLAGGAFCIELAGFLQGFFGEDLHKGVEAPAVFYLLQKKLNGGYAGGSAVEQFGLVL